MSAQNVTDLISIRSNYIAALLSDSANPKPTYDWDGRMVRREEWRAALTKAIKDITELISIVSGQDSPWEIDAEILP